MCMGTGNGHFVERESSTQRKADITEGVVQIRPGVQTHLCQKASQVSTHRGWERNGQNPDTALARKLSPFPRA